MKKVLLTLIAVPSLAMAGDFEEHAAYTGAYFGLGVSASDIGQKVEYYAPTSVRFYAGNDPAVANYTDMEIAEDVDVNAHSSQTRLAGTAVIGFGKRIAAAKGAYVSLEAGVDFGRNIHSQETDGYYEYKDGHVKAIAGDGAKYNSSNSTGALNNDDAVYDAARVDEGMVYKFNPTSYDVKVRHSGVTPWFGLRAGWVDGDTGMLVFAKVGGAYKKAKLQYIDQYDAKPVTEVKVNGLVPLVALGVEKAFGNKATIRLEAEYQWGKNKKQDGDVMLMSTDDLGQPNGGQVRADDASKLLAKGAITIRGLLCYNIKIGQ